MDGLLCCFRRWADIEVMVIVPDGLDLGSAVCAGETTHVDMKMV